MTRRQRAAAPTVPAPVPTLAEAAQELRARHREPGTLCGQCVTVDAQGQSVPLGREHKPCAWDRCACACRGNTAPTRIVGPAMSNESTQPIPSLVDFLL